MAKEIYCNKCGKKMDMWDVRVGISIEGQLGYGSQYDGEDLRLDLCCGCTDELIASCQISPLE